MTGRPETSPSAPAGPATGEAAVTAGTAPEPEKTSERATPAATSAARDGRAASGDRAFHLARVCGQFHVTVSEESARRIARLFTGSEDGR